MCTFLDIYFYFLRFGLVACNGLPTELLFKNFSARYNVHFTKDLEKCRSIIETIIFIQASLKKNFCSDRV